MPDPKLTRRAAIATVARGHFSLSELVPKSFGDWRIDDSAATGIVNPQTEAMLNRIYSQLLDRVYVDTSGRRIMLSIAYGDDQADDSVQLHYPEVCYPAQGFQVKGNRREQIRVSSGIINVRRLETQFGDSRFEPVTYWTIVGDQQVIGGWERKKAEIRHGLKGEIVDGLLFRVSSIKRDSSVAFQDQDVFVNDIVAAMGPSARRQLAGLA
jgi:EpsI family protein